MGGVPVGTIMSRLARARIALAAAARGRRRDAQEYERCRSAVTSVSSPISTASSTAAERRDVEAWLDGEPAARDRLAALAESASHRAPRL